MARSAPIYTDPLQKHVVVPNLGPGETLEYETRAFGPESLAAFAQGNTACSAGELNRLVLARFTDFCSGKSKMTLLSWS